MDISDLIVDEEFESVIPPLDDEEFKFLKESILQDGEVYHPIVVWNNIIVDGHHRYKIIQEHPEIKYRITERVFENRYDAISWICLNQLGRRNISNTQKTILIGRRYNAEHFSMEIFKGNQHTQKTGVPQNEAHQKEDRHATANRIAKEMGTSRATVERSAEFVNGMDAANEVLPGVSNDIKSGKIKPKQADVRAIAKAPVEERKEMAEKLYKTKANTLTQEEKDQRKSKRDFLQALRRLDATHMPSETNKIQPEDTLLTFQSEAEKFIETMDFCFDYSPELLTEQKYLTEVKEIIEPLKDYIKNLEENRYANII